MPKRQPNRAQMLQARVSALELLLQQLVFLMEVEPRPTAEKVAAWLTVCHTRQRATRATDPRTLEAFASLARKVAGAGSCKNLFSTTSNCMKTPMKLLYGFKTRKGPVFIGQTPDGRYHPVWQSDSLGSYHSITGAIEDVAGGHTFTPPDGTDLGSLGISCDPSEWVRAKELM